MNEVCRDRCRILLCSELGRGKTSLLKSIYKTIATNFDKYGVIPLFVDASEITFHQDPIISYLLTKYSDKLTDGDKQTNVDRKLLLKEYFNSDKYKFLLIIDSTELLNDCLCENMLRELKQFNQFKSISIIFSTSNSAFKDNDVFIEYKIVENYGRLDETQILNYLKKNGFEVDHLSLFWQELLNSPFYLTKFVKTHIDSSVLNTDMNFDKSKLIEEYLFEFVKLNSILNEGDEFEKRKNLIFNIIPEKVYYSNDNHIKLSSLEYGKYVNSIPAINMVKSEDTFYECEISHLIYFFFFKARYAKNYIKTHNIQDCIEFLNKTIFNDDILVFIGEHLDISNENRTSSKLYECLNYLRLNRSKCDLSEYQIAVCNILGVFINTCSKQLSELDLSYLDLRKCDFIGVNCQKTNFSNSFLNDHCLIPQTSFTNNSHVAIQDKGNYFVLADDASSASDYCCVNVFDGRSGELKSEFALPFICSVCEFNENAFAVAFGSDKIQISTFRYRDGEEISHLSLHKKFVDFLLVGMYNNELFYFDNKILYSINKTGEITTYAEFPLDQYNKIKLLNKQFEFDNNGIILYKDGNERIDLFYIYFSDLLNQRYSAAVKYSVNKFEQSAKVYFSDYEPILAIGSNDKFEIYNYRSQNKQPDDTDDYIRKSMIYCGNRVIRLGTDISNDVQQVLSLNSFVMLHSSNANSIFMSTDTKHILFYDYETEQSISLTNNSLIDNLKIENIEYKQLAIYNKNFKHFGAEGKRYVFDIESKKMRCEHIDSKSNVFRFKCYDNGNVSYQYYKNNNDLIKDYCKFHFDNFQCLTNELDASYLDVFFYYKYDKMIPEIYKSPLAADFFNDDYVLDINNGCVFFINQGHTLLSACYDGDVLVLSQNYDKNYDKNIVRLRIYNYVSNYLIVDFIVPDNVIPEKVHLSKSGEVTRVRSLFLGQIYFKKFDSFYKIYINDFVFAFNFMGHQIKEQRRSIEQSNYDPELYNEMFQIVWPLCEFLLTHESERVIFTNALNQGARFIFNFIIRCLNRELSPIDKQCVNCFSLLVMDILLECGQVEYARDFLCGPNKFVTFSDKGNVFNSALALGNFLEHYTGVMSSEYQCVVNRKNCMVINCVNGKIIINHPIFDLDISGANFRNVLGLSESNKRIIKMYSGEI